MLMDSYSFSGRPKNLALQEKALAEAQKKLDRIDKMRAEMAKQVEVEQKRLEQMRDVADSFTSSSQPTTPSLSSSAPASFASQYDQFNSIKSADRLKATGNDGIGTTAIEKLTEAMGVKGPTGNVSHYRTSDRDEHWSELNTDPGKTVYISGYYYSSGVDSKEYEYIIGSTLLPVRVGDMIRAPVHHKGHGDGKFLAGHDRRFIVTDIYSKEKFTPYHDVIW